MYSKTPIYRIPIYHFTMDLYFVPNIIFVVKSYPYLPGYPIYHVASCLFLITHGKSRSDCIVMFVISN